MECCHCERGEAIQEQPARAALDRFVAALLTMTPVSPIYDFGVPAHLGTDLNWHQVSSSVPFLAGRQQNPGR